MNRIKAKLTRANAIWVLKTNVQSWVIQGSIAGVLSVVGVGAVSALVSAKAAAYAVFLVQCVSAIRSR